MTDQQVFCFVAKLLNNNVTDRQIIDSHNHQAAKGYINYYSWIDFTHEMSLFNVAIKTKLM